MGCLDFPSKDRLPEISEQELAGLPGPVKIYLRYLRELLLLVLKENKELKERAEKLEGKANKNSSNSSKPPSSDGPHERASRDGKRDKKSKGKAGGKRGHKGHRQSLLEPTDQKDIFPEQCGCGNKDFQQFRAFYIHQEIELPEIQLEVMHFILHEGTCTQCGKTVKARVPAEHSTGFGARLSALIADMAGIAGNSRTCIQEFCESVLKFRISLGAIQKVIDRVSEAIKPIYARIGEVARSSEVNGVDETMWWESGMSRWLWVLANDLVALFMVHARRSRQAFEALIEEWKGILISDGYGVYQRWVNLRQTCLAHLIRDAKWLAEQVETNVQDFGKQGLELLRRLCSMAHAPPEEQGWNEFYTELLDLIFDNIQRKDVAGRFARRLLRELDSLWVFLEVAGVV